jgi:hypothetical protein
VIEARLTHSELARELAQRCSGDTVIGDQGKEDSSPKATDTANKKTVKK